MSSQADMVKSPSFDEALVEALRSVDARLIRRGDDETGSPYLWRGYLGDRSGGRDRDVGIFLHRFVSSDEMELHCHPWAWSWSFILSGGYVEHRVTGDVDFESRTAILDGVTERVELFTADGVKTSTNLIEANTFHRIELMSPEVWTLFVHGPRVQDWGFVPMNRYGEKLPLRLVQ